jgi:tRNA A-37 threonylcarbamoyl transferase component Bud32
MDLAREDGITNFMILTVNGPMDQLIAAIEQNPEEINRADNEGRTALTYAYNQNPGVVDLLRINDAQIIPDKYGHIPSDYDPWFVDQGKIQQATTNGQINNLNDLFKVEWFGKGAESEVFLATSKTTGKKYIFKAIKADGEVDREIYFLKRVQSHPAFVHYYGDFTVPRDQLPIQDLDEFEEEPVSVIILEYLEGKPLLTLGLQPIEEVVSIAKQLVAAIQYLHVQGVADGDLHSGNVMYLNSHVVKIIDLGLACAEEGPYSCDKMYPNALRLFRDFIFGAHNVTTFDIMKEVDLIRVAQLIEDLFPGFHEPWEDKVYSGEFRVEVEDPFFRQLLEKVLTLDYMDRITLDEFYHRLFRQYP